MNKTTSGTIPTSMGNISSDGQRVLANFILAMSDTNVHWYSVLDLHSAISSMARLLRMHQINFNTTMKALELGYTRSDGIFVLSHRQFDQFLVTYKLQLCCEVTYHNAPGHSNQKYFIRIGNKNLKTMPAPNHMGAGPRPLCITVATRQFCNGMVDVLRHHVDKDNNNSRPWELQKN